MTTDPSWLVALASAGCAFAALLGMRLSRAVCRNLVPFDDGPRPAKPPVGALVVGAAVVGAGAAWRGADLPTLAVVTVLTLALAACFYSDVRCGIVPDSFTLAPLGLVLLISVCERHAAPAVSAGVAFVPFAVTALLSKGRGMGWGDVKLVALGAAVLGLQSSIVAFAAACLAAVVIAAVRRRVREPIAFVPYLAAAMATVIVVPIFPIAPA